MTFVVELQSGFTRPAPTCDPAGSGPRGRKLPGLTVASEAPSSPPLPSPQFPINATPRKLNCATAVKQKTEFNINFLGILDYFQLPGLRSYIRPREVSRRRLPSPAELRCTRPVTRTQSTVWNIVDFLLGLTVALCGWERRCLNAPNRLGTVTNNPQEPPPVRVCASVRTAVWGHSNQVGNVPLRTGSTDSKGVFPLLFPPPIKTHTLSLNRSLCSAGIKVERQANVRFLSVSDWRQNLRGCQAALHAPLSPHTNICTTDRSDAIAPDKITTHPLAPKLSFPAVCSFIRGLWTSLPRSSRWVQ